MRYNYHKWSITVQNSPKAVIITVMKRSRNRSCRRLGMVNSQERWTKAYRNESWKMFTFTLQKRKNNCKVVFLGYLFHYVYLFLESINEIFFPFLLLKLYFSHQKKINDDKDLSKSCMRLSMPKEK